MGRLTVKTFQREDTIRLIPKLTTPDGQPHAEPFTACAVKHLSRPSEYIATQDIDGKQGIVYPELAPGLYDVYAYIEAADLNVPCGQFLVQ
jgi:hypothetical protein